MNFMTLELLAQAGGLADPVIGVGAVTGVVVAVIAAMFAGFKGGMVKRDRMTLEAPVPEVPTRKVPTPPTWDAHRAVCDRVSRLEEAFGELRREQASQFKDMMTATNGLESRLGSKLEGIAREIHHRIDEQFKPHPPRR